MNKYELGIIRMIFNKPHILFNETCYKAPNKILICFTISILAIKIT